MMRLNFRMAKQEDVDLYYTWTNDTLVRQNSFEQSEVPYDDHVRWFKEKINNKYYYFYLFFDRDNIPVGQVRLDKSKGELVVGLSIDENFRGKGFGVEMLNSVCQDYKRKHQDAIIVAYIKETNISSYRVFIKAGFNNSTKTVVKGIPTYRLLKEL